MDTLRLQIISQKIFELLELFDLTDDEFFDRCITEPVDKIVGIIHPDTGDIALGFCNHKNAGLMFYLPEDLEFSEDQSTQIPENSDPSEVRRQILMRQLPSKDRQDNPE